MSQTSLVSTRPPSGPSSLEGARTRDLVVMTYDVEGLTQHLD